MGKITPSAAKNAIRRALVGVVDPHPSASQIHRIWTFFESQCAYCGRPMVRGDRDAHIDHLVSTYKGGSNSLGNFVLSCSICNGDEKRDEHWESFLRKKAPDDKIFKMRKEKIEAWVASCTSASMCDPAVLKAVDQEVTRAIASFDEALHNIRKLKSDSA